MPTTVSRQKLVKALQMAHAYVTRLCADLKPGELDWHTKGCAETVRKQLEHLTGAERYFASAWAGRSRRNLPPTILSATTPSSWPCTSESSRVASEST